MDTKTLVEFQVEAGERLIIQLIRDGVRMEAAFWAKTTEDGIWFLYIATPIVEEKGLPGAYRILQSSHQRLQGIPLSLSDIKLVGKDDPLTRDVLATLARFPGRIATRLGGTQLGGVPIEEAYIYPSYLFSVPGSGPMTQDEVLRELFRLMNRGTGVVPPSRITLKDGAAFTGVPFSIQSGSHRPMVIQFIAEGEPSPRVLGIDEIASIQ
jgi:hypothetical protein